MSGGFVFVDEAVPQGPFVLPCQPLFADLDRETVDRYLSTLRGIEPRPGSYQLFIRPLTRDEIIDSRETADAAVDGSVLRGAQARMAEREGAELDEDARAAVRTMRRWGDVLADAQLALAVDEFLDEDGEPMRAPGREGQPFDVFRDLLERLPSRAISEQVRGQILRMVGALTDLVPEGKARSWPRPTSPPSATSSTGGSATSAEPIAESGQPEATAGTAPSNCESSASAETTGS